MFENLRSISDQHLEAKSEGQQLSARETIPRSQSSKDTSVVKDMATQTVYNLKIYRIVVKNSDSTSEHEKR